MRTAQGAPGFGVMRTVHPRSKSTGAMSGTITLASGLQLSAVACRERGDGQERVCSFDHMVRGAQCSKCKACQDNLAKGRRSNSARGNLLQLLRLLSFRTVFHTVLILQVKPVKHPSVSYQAKGSLGSLVPTAMLVQVFRTLRHLRIKQTVNRGGPRRRRGNWHLLHASSHSRAGAGMTMQGMQETLTQGEVVAAVRCSLAAQTSRMLACVELPPKAT